MNLLRSTYAPCARLTRCSSLRRMFHAKGQTLSGDLNGRKMSKQEEGERKIRVADFLLISEAMSAQESKNWKREYGLLDHLDYEDFSLIGVIGIMFIAIFATLTVKTKKEKEELLNASKGDI